MTRRLSALVVAVLIGVLLAAGAGQALALRTVTDVSNRFIIGVPTNWQVKTSSGDPALEATAPASGKLTPDSVNVIVRDMPMALSPQSCVQEAQGVLKYVIHSYTTVSEGPQKVAALPAYSYEYDWQTKTGEPRRSIAVCTTIGHRAFMIVGTTENTPAKVQAVMPEIAQIVQTFRPIAQQEAASHDPWGTHKDKGK